MRPERSLERHSLRNTHYHHSSIRLVPTELGYCLCSKGQPESLRSLERDSLRSSHYYHSSILRLLAQTELGYWLRSKGQPESLRDPLRDTAFEILTTITVVY
jgi:hypothetical protein